MGRHFHGKMDPKKSQFSTFLSIEPPFFDNHGGEKIFVCDTEVKETPKIQKKTYINAIPYAIYKLIFCIFIPFRTFRYFTC